MNIKLISSKINKNIPTPQHIVSALYKQREDSKSSQTPKAESNKGAAAHLTARLSTVTAE